MWHQFITVAANQMLCLNTVNARRDVFAHRWYRFVNVVSRKWFVGSVALEITETCMNYIFNVFLQVIQALIILRHNAGIKCSKCANFKHRVYMFSLLHFNSIPKCSHFPFAKKVIDFCKSRFNHFIDFPSLEFPKQLLNTFVTGKDSACAGPIVCYPERPSKSFPITESTKLGAPIRFRFQWFPKSTIRYTGSVVQSFIDTFKMVVNLIRF